MKKKSRVVFAVTGASGMPLARAILKCYSSLPSMEIHLIVSKPASIVLKVENTENLEDINILTQFSYDVDDMASPPASGSWQHDGMIICPCSMSSLGFIANGCGINLIHRAADVCLKERRPLVLVTRETPLNRIQLMNMLKANEAGATVMPFSPNFYIQDSSMEGNFQQFAGRILDQLKIPNNLCSRWQE